MEHISKRTQKLPAEHSLDCTASCSFKCLYSCLCIELQRKRTNIVLFIAVLFRLLCSLLFLPLTLKVCKPFGDLYLQSHLQGKGEPKIRKVSELFGRLWWAQSSIIFWEERLTIPREGGERLTFLIQARLTRLLYVHVLTLPWKSRY